MIFSGDLGNRENALLCDPDQPEGCDVLVMESTYGNRRHPDVSIYDQLEGVIRRTFARGGVLLIPAFAVGRSQQLIWMMNDDVESVFARAEHKVRDIEVEDTAIHFDLDTWADYDRLKTESEPDIGDRKGETKTTE